jgi:hypothetical protein
VIKLYTGDCQEKILIITDGENSLVHRPLCFVSVAVVHSARLYGINAIEEHAMMKTFNEPNNSIGTHIQRWTGLVLTACFFLGVLALAMHHHDVFFQLKRCAICKAKASFSGANTTIKADFPLSVATLNHCSDETNCSFFQIKLHRQVPFIVSLLPNPFLNKAPPLAS